MFSVNVDVVFQVIIHNVIVHNLLISSTVASLKGKLIKSTEYGLIDSSMSSNCKGKLKADRPLSRNYPHMPTDDRHTYQHLRLAMLFTALGKAEPLISTTACQKSDLDL